ncbi:MAG TPA: alkaline phosphatase family protein [Rhodocyclaceae bacterium]|nr:alkaline phosphatase family protein [Rhodocyclaceae bacterium]
MSLPFLLGFEVNASKQSVGDELATFLGGDNVVAPDYKGRGLFNLAVSLARVCGAEVAMQYADLRLPTARSATSAWCDAHTVILFLIDGLGDEFLSANRDRAPALWADRADALTSVFPSTTATAITTLMTAQPGSIHGLLGWFVRDEETGRIVAPLPMKYRTGESVTDEALIARMLNTSSMFDSAQRQTCLVTLPELAAGPYSRHHAAGARLYAYNGLEDLPDSVARAAAEGKAPKFIYAYTPLLDGAAHDNGIASEAALQTLARIDSAYARMRALVPDALIVASADHGFIDSPAERYIDLGAHAGLYAMLRGPLTGERRAVYCHVQPKYREEFGCRVQEKFGHALCAVPASAAMASGLFGPGSRELAETRSGDWILIARDDWTLFDSLPGKAMHPMIGVHGGLSQAEMKVPLIVRDTSHRHIS